MYNFHSVTKLLGSVVLNNKTVLITGASRGIGRAIAIEFSKNGYNVGINYLKSKEDAKATLEDVLSNKVDADIFKYDVSSCSESEELMSAFIKRFGHIDVLINNAGIASISPISSTSIEDWDKIISTNLSSAFYLTKFALPYFLKNGGGSIINISSMWAQSGASCEVAYSASKAGLVGLTKASAKELGPSNIRVNCISPGFIDTDMNKSLSSDDFEYFKASTPLQRIGNAFDVAPLAVFLASEQSNFITGANITVDGGF